MWIMYTEAGHLTEAVRATTAAFSNSAATYDYDESKNRVARWTRAENLSYLRAIYRPSENLLELGCGTGTEALQLARAGSHIVATDAAPGMISKLQQKLAQGTNQDIADHIMTYVLPASEVNSLEKEIGIGGFDGAFSSFGPLNCEPDLAPVASALGRLVRPGGKVVISLLGRFCLWETAWYLAHGKPAKAIRRWGGQAEATVRGEWQAERIKVYYWSADHVERTFSDDFKLTDRSALPWMLPPQYLSGIFRGRSRLFRMLAAAEKRTARYWPANVLGDHIRFTFVRK
jgi:SAM-dependent methyltransferase